MTTDTALPIAVRPLADWQRGLLTPTDDPNRSYHALMRDAGANLMTMQREAGIKLFLRDIVGCVRNRAQVLSINADLCEDAGDRDESLRMEGRAEALAWLAQQFAAMGGLSITETVRYPFDAPAKWVGPGIK